MLPVRFFPLVWKYVIRHRVRSILTIGGVATAMFLFYSVEAIQQGVRAATRQTARDTVLVVYRQDRFCPFSSNLPQDYGARIAAIPGVKTAVPIKVAVSTCHTSLDVVTFRGVPESAFDTGMLDHARIVAGSIEDWKRRSDAALIGDRLAKRRGLKVGDRLDLAGVTITVAAILESEEPQDQNVAYGHLDYVQRASGDSVGMVTQFNVKVDDPGTIGRVAKAIDEEFRTAQEPTSTWAEKAFVARVMGDLVEISDFAGWLGLGCLVGVFALVANAIVLSVQDRIKDHAVMQTLGYTHGLIAKLIIAEGVLMGLCGGVIGLLAGMLVSRWGVFSFTVEGFSVHLHAGASSIAVGLVVSALIGVVAGLFPAWKASRQETAACFRAV